MLNKAHITVDDSVGATIPYRLGFYGLPLTYTTEAENTEGVVTLWDDDPDAPFTCAVWGDNQQGCWDADWGSSKFQFLTNMFEHMVAQGVDFGISSGDMASHAYYASEIRPCILDTTDAIFGRTRPYYVAWGNHDTVHPENKPYFETGAIDDPDYGSSDSGNYYLYRNNVLFVFIDNHLGGKASNSDASNAAITATTNWVASVLSTDRARNAKFRVLVTHLAFWLECWGSHIDNPSYLEEVAKTGGIDMVLSGHMHGYERIFKNGIMQVTNGGAGHLDHKESVERNYGDATVVGGHKDLPYLWARQKSAAESGVLGPAEPVRMGCVQGYGELKVDGNVLTYTAHAFNADGSYIGVCDEFSLTNTAFAASAPASAPTPCADPSAFAVFTETPVTNAAWAAYKEAIGESFSYTDGSAPVVNVSKVEIEKFLAWLNGASGTYRLPTVGELETAFAGNLRREVAEWTSSVDPVTGWCRILGSPELAADGTWARAEDRPCIATAGCHANYLGFRLATGAAPVETIDSESLDAALVALAEIAEPAAVYKWTGGELVDISSDWTSPSGDLAYNEPVVFTGSGNLSYDLGSYNVVLGGGFAAPNASGLAKNGAGTLTVKGVAKDLPSADEQGWKLESGGALVLDGVTFLCGGVRFRSGDGNLRLNGDNDFSGADVYLNNAVQECTNYVAATAAPATFRARRITNKGAAQVDIGEGVSVRLAKDFSANLDFTIAVDGELDAEAFNMLANEDPWIVGSGTVSVGYFGTYENSWIRLAVSNVVFTSAEPIRSNKAKTYTTLFVAGDEVHLSSTCDWAINETDAFGTHIFVLGDTARSARPKLVVEGSYDAVFSPYATSGTANGGPKTWDLEMAGTGTLTVKKLPNGDIVAKSGTIRFDVTLDDVATLVCNSDGVAFTGTFENATLPSGAKKAKLRIDGARLPAGDYTVLESVAEDAADHATIDLKGTAIGGRKATLSVKDGDLVLTVPDYGMVVVFR